MRMNRTMAESEALVWAAMGKWRPARNSRF